MKKQKVLTIFIVAIFSILLLFIPLFSMEISSIGEVIIEEKAYFLPIDFIISNGTVAKEFTYISFVSHENGFGAIFLILAVMTIFLTIRKKTYWLGVVSGIALIVYNYFLANFTTLYVSETAWGQGFTGGSNWIVFAIIETILIILYSKYFYHILKK